MKGNGGRIPLLLLLLRHNHLLLLFSLWDWGRTPSQFHPSPPTIAAVRAREEGSQSLNTGFLRWRDHLHLVGCSQLHQRGQLLHPGGPDNLPPVEKVFQCHYRPVVPVVLALLDCWILHGVSLPVLGTPPPNELTLLWMPDADIVRRDGEEAEFAGEVACCYNSRVF